MAASLGGMLLVAGPELVDPNFDHAVVMILEHGDEGAMGVILNRPSLTMVAEHLPAWADLAADPPFIFGGGPVSLTTAICLGHARAEIEEEGWTPIVGSVGAVNLDAEPAAAARLVSGVRVFAGYAGWGAGQLEAELEVGGWIVAEAVDGDVLSADPHSLWREVLRRQGGALAILANLSREPTLN